MIAVHCFENRRFLLILNLVGCVRYSFRNSKWYESSLLKLLAFWRDLEDESRRKLSVLSLNAVPLGIRLLGMRSSCFSKVAELIPLKSRSRSTSAREICG